MARVRTLPEPEPPAKHPTVLDEAKSLVYGDRGADYGHPLDDYTRCVGAFNALTGRDLTAEEGVIFMCCVKLARESHRHKRDNPVDLAGYSECLQRIHDERARRATRAPSGPADT